MLISFSMSQHKSAAHVCCNADQFQQMNDKMNQETESCFIINSKHKLMSRVNKKNIVQYLRKLKHSHW